MGHNGKRRRWPSTEVLLRLSARRALRDAISERDEALRQTRVLEAAANELIATVDPVEVIAVAVRLAAEMASPPGARAPRANYCRIIGDTVRVEAEFDAEGVWLGTTWPLEEHPHLAEVARIRQPRSGRIDPAALGPAVRAVNRRQGVGHGGWVPVVLGGELHGMLAVAGRNRPLTDQELSRCVVIAQIMQLALGNALSHQSLQRAALTDPLTSLANRRGLEARVLEQRGRRPLTVLAIDVDGLKALNDRRGHVAGDELLMAVANSIATVMRSGDVAARLGGDEFVCVIFDADERAGTYLADRMLEAIGSVSIQGHEARASIGVAHATVNVSLEDAVRRADTAMYAAKQAGGMRYRLAGSPVRPGATAAGCETSLDRHQLAK